MMMNRPAYSYAGRMPDCGCMIAVAVDYGDNRTGNTVAQWIKEGLIIERVPHEQVRAEFVAGCPHQTRQGRLPLMDHTASP